MCIRGCAPVRGWVCVRVCSGRWRAYTLPVRVTRALADRDLVVSAGDVGDKGQKGGVGRHGKIGPIGSKGILLASLAHVPSQAHRWALGEQLVGIFIVCALHVIRSLPGLGSDQT